ncbi:HlyD family efflux transporter periplasmic adaptor subunit [Aquabacterium fontiphilum]|uniref:HlyD family secretion protein n=1 Tax=Aquabacterium fontiphilum TaxID=450365 RepID=UPI001378453F|nr:HlyD family efflux transporter periplasmic adaptor subunit [Aquabacterium fontiphilum]NBD19374.1 HlyD family efflux transporter periplasmic adaptor subunit [Aquabacterium fontiphilum]
MKYLPSPRTAGVALAAAGLCLTLSGCLETEPALQLPGYIEADITSVASPVAGTLQQVQVKEGQLVQPGELLYVLESAQEEAKLAEAHAVKAQAAAQSRNLSKGARAAEIEGLKAKVRYAEAQLEQARTQLRRTEQLRNNGFVSDMQTLQERTQVQLAKAQVEDAMAALRTAQQAARVDEQAAAAAGVDAAAAGVAQVEWLLKQKRVTAPVGGVVQELYRRQGEYAQPGATTMTILHSDTLRVRFFVPNDLRPRYLPGTKVKVSISGCDGALEATVTRVSARPEYTQPMMFSLELRDRLSFLTEARLAASSTCTAPPGTPVGIVVPAGEKAAS